jgi:hypothetical protein
MDALGQATRGRLREYAYTRNVILLKDISARMLTEWRAAWTFNKDSGGPAVAWSVVKTLLRWAHSIDLIPSDVSGKQRPMPSVRKQLQSLTRDEMASLFVKAGVEGSQEKIGTVYFVGRGAGA